MPAAPSRLLITRRGPITGYIDRGKMKRNHSLLVFVCLTFVVVSAFFQAGFLRRFLWLAGQAFDGVLCFWPVSVLLIVLMIVSVVRDHRKQQLRQRDSVCLCPLFGTVIILYSGVFFEKRECFYWLPYVGMFVYMILAIYSVIRLKRIWRTVSLILLLILWYNLWCLLVSSMSIAGDWM